jgi:hypothetical protein
MLSEFVSNSVPAGWKFPFDVKVRTSDSTGAALQATFVINTDSVMFQPVNIGRANIKAGLLLAVINANRAVYDFKVRGFMHIKAVQKELVFDCCAH